MQVDSRSGLYFLAEPRSLLSRGVIASENESTQRALRSFVCRIGPLQGAALVGVRTPDGKLVTLQWRTAP